jgi:hypothetical protein
MPRTAIADVVADKRFNVPFRLRCRVIDYLPRRLDDFVVSQCDTCQKRLRSGARACDGGGGKHAVSRHWQFALLVQGSREPAGVDGDGGPPLTTEGSTNNGNDNNSARSDQLPIVIEGDAAVCLLSPISPLTDLS